MMRNIKPNDNPILILPDENNPKTQLLQLTKGMPIICHKTNKKMEILNSDRFVITSINEKEIQFTNELLKEQNKPDMKISVQDFNKNISIWHIVLQSMLHKEKHSKNHILFMTGEECKRGKYVALSRATKLENIQIYLDKIELLDIEFRETLRTRDNNL